MPKVSIIMTAYNPSRYLVEMTMASLANITRYTDADMYELILMDCAPKHNIRDDYGVLKIDKHLKPEIDPGYYEAMNIGAGLAEGEYLCFIENDMFVSEGWLNDLCYYLDNDLLDAVIPDQFPRSRDKIKEFYAMTYEEALNAAGIEQGLVLIRKSSFDKIGGWQKIGAQMGWQNFYSRINDAGVRLGNTAKVLISHICGATYFYKVENEFDKLAKTGE
jgi:glycosyltransferase involved in cell wall biosynthesis